MGSQKDDPQIFCRRINIYFIEAVKQKKSQLFTFLGIDNIMVPLSFSFQHLLTHHIFAHETVDTHYYEHCTWAWKMHDKINIFMSPWKQCEVIASSLTLMNNRFLLQLSDLVLILTNTFVLLMSSFWLNSHANLFRNIDSIIPYGWS